MNPQLASPLTDQIRTVPLSPTERKEAIAEFRHIGRDWDQMIVDKDIARVVNSFASDAQTLHPNHAAARGLAEIREWWTEFLKLPSLVFTTEPEVIDVSAYGDMAYEIGLYNLEFDTPKGHYVDKGRYVLVYKRMNGEWKLVVDIDNSSIPLPQG